MTTDQACQDANERSAQYAELCEQIHRHEHRLFLSGIGSTEWEEALTSIVRLWTELEAL